MNGDNIHRKDSNRVKQSAALLEAIKEYDAQKWKIIGQKVGKPAKVFTDSRGWTPSI